MMDSIIEFLTTRYPYLLIALATGTVAFYAARYHYTKVAPLKNSMADLQGKIDLLPCERHGGEIEKIRGGFEAREEIKSVLLEVSKWIARLDNSMIDVFLKKSGPCRLTKAGNIMLEESGAKRIVDDHTDFLVRKIDGMDPKTPYDVEEYAMNVLLSHVGNSMFNELTDYVYYSPERKILNVDGEDVEVRVFMPWILRSMSVYLRDRYFELRPGLEKKDSKIQRFKDSIPADFSADYAG
ncbi:MAG: hypothetical protein LBT76_05880 [Tannerella sp.]|jgi:hypothetical protein|nr:hypothetical protein [Tannerella sp.]